MRHLACLAAFGMVLLAGCSAGAAEEQANLELTNARPGNPLCIVDDTYVKVDYTIWNGGPAAAKDIRVLFESRANFGDDAPVAEDERFEAIAALPVGATRTYEDVVKIRPGCSDEEPGAKEWNRIAIIVKPANGPEQRDWVHVSCTWEAYQHVDGTHCDNLYADLP